MKDQVMQFVRWWIPLIVCCGCGITTTQNTLPSSRSSEPEQAVHAQPAAVDLAVASQPTAFECQIQSPVELPMQSLPRVEPKHTASDSKPKPQAKGCWSSAETTRDIVGCHGQALTQSEAQMHAAYRAIVVRRKGDTRFLKVFERAQRAWLAFRNAYTEAMYCAHSPAVEYGSGWRGCQMADEAQLNRERTAQLKGWAEGVEEGELCQGERPRKR